MTYVQVRTIQFFYYQHDAVSRYSTKYYFTTASSFCCRKGFAGITFVAKNEPAKPPEICHIRAQSLIPYEVIEELLFSVARYFFWVSVLCWRHCDRLYRDLYIRHYKWIHTVGKNIKYQQPAKGASHSGFSSKQSQMTSTQDSRTFFRSSLKTAPIWTIILQYHHDRSRHWKSTIASKHVMQRSTPRKKTDELAQSMRKNGMLWLHIV